MKKNMNIKVIAAIVVLALIAASLFLINILKNNKAVEEMKFVTNKGNIIQTEYIDLGKFKMKIPKDFEVMSEEYLELKYPTDNRPKLVYTNEDGSINFAFNLDSAYLDDEKLTDYVSTVESLFSKTGYSVNRMDYEANGIKFYTLTLKTPAIDSVIYNYMTIFSIDGHLMVISFNCIDEYTDEWSDVSKFVIQSIKIK